MNLIVKYKYHTRMPIAIKNKNQFIDDILSEKKFNSFLSGNIMLWISPVYNKRYWQIIFDIDIKKIKHIPINRLYNKLYIIKEKLNNKFNNNFSIERSYTGFHFISNLYFQYNIFGNILKFKEQIKELFNDDDYYDVFTKYVDINTIFRDLPIKRIGYDESNKTIYFPLNEKKYLKYLNNIKNKNPIDLYSKNFWERYIKTYLIPKKKISRLELVSILKLFTKEISELY